MLLAWVFLYIFVTSQFPFSASHAKYSGGPTSRFTFRESPARQVRKQLACRGFPIRWKRLLALMLFEPIHVLISRVL